MVHLECCKLDCRALWGPGSDPYRSVPTQTGTNHMQWPGLRESDQDAAAAGGGHPSIASEQQYLFLARQDKPLLMGQYVVAVRADMGQPLVQIEVGWGPNVASQLLCCVVAWGALGPNHVALCTCAAHNCVDVYRSANLLAHLVAQHAESDVVSCLFEGDACLLLNTIE